MSLSRPCWIEARSTLTTLLSEGNRTLQDDSDLRTKALVPQNGAKMHLPAKIGKIQDYGLINFILKLKKLLIPRLKL